MCWIHESVYYWGKNPLVKGYNLFNFAGNEAGNVYKLWLWSLSLWMGSLPATRVIAWSHRLWLCGHNAMLYIVSSDSKDSRPTLPLGHHFEIQACGLWWYRCDSYVDPVTIQNPPWLFCRNMVSHIQATPMPHLHPLYTPVTILIAALSTVLIGVTSPWMWQLLLL